MSKIHWERLADDGIISPKSKTPRSKRSRKASVTTEDDMTTIQKSIGTIEASQLLKQALGATSIEHVIEHQNDEVFSRFLVEIPAGQVAYSAYRSTRGGKAQDGSTLPLVLSAEMSVAWEAFAAAVMAGHGVDLAYQAYLAARLGVDFNGNAAPDWDELRNNKPDIAAAWADAANALK
mgnify:FL=1